MVSDTKPRNGTFTTFLVRVWKGLGNFKAQNEALNRLIVQNEALQKRLDLALGDAKHWKAAATDAKIVRRHFIRVRDAHDRLADAHETLKAKAWVRNARGQLQRYTDILEEKGQ